MILKINRDQSKAIENFVFKIIITSDRELMGHLYNYLGVRRLTAVDPVEWKAV